MKQIIAFAGEKVQENPSIAAGACAFMVAFSLVAGNALTGQPGGHPDPIWATRDPVTTRSLKPETVQRETDRIAPYTLSPERIPIPMMRPDRHERTEIRESEVTEAARPITFLVRDAQEGLARLGHYDGAIDGIYGPRTREAVMKFQSSHGLDVSGEVSARLTGAIDAALVSESSKESLVHTAAFSTDDIGREPAFRQVPPAAEEDVRQTALIARIQIGLNNFGEPGIVIDGTIDGNTQAAIRKFQARYDLPVDGQPSRLVMEKLEDIGALRSR